MWVGSESNMDHIRADDAVSQNFYQSVLEDSLELLLGEALLLAWPAAPAADPAADAATLLPTRASTGE